MSWRRFAATAAVLVTGGLVSASAAQASFHLVKVREVFPGSTARPQSGYVELQMFSAGEILVHFGVLEVFSANGTLLRSFSPPSDLKNGASQSTFLIADSEYAAQFPTAPAPDFTDPNLNLPASGAVCWPKTEPPEDCVSWGGFTGRPALEALHTTDIAPAAAAGIPDGMAIRRSIAGGACSTLLEEADDTNNSAADFALAAPAPRDNASPILEGPCRTGPSPEGPGGGGSAPGGSTPQTRINRTPGRRIHDRTPSVRFAADQGASFECRLDRQRFRPCRSPFTSRRLSLGHHRFEVRARDAAGTDPSPAVYVFTVLPADL
ncbi:MAG TPA: hypothetical protein VHI77_02490 [Solirubrobacterales bacterium]|jgi:hypothetical protein|nr:hypothetical protein [Solirubrobacterales bacterium]